LVLSELTERNPPRALLSDRYGKRERRIGKEVPLKRNVAIFPLFLAVGIALALSACASGPSNSGPSNSDPSGGVQVIRADGSSITLGNVFLSDDENNLRIADEHCRKFGKVAQFVAEVKAQRLYNCVAP
jgi:hypothetical protein